jgi:hypothetical protein
MYEGDEAFTLKAELPGFSKDDVQVEIKDNVLTLKGERKRESNEKEAQYHRVERVFGAFRRSFVLPALMDADMAEAGRYHPIQPYRRNGAAKPGARDQAGDDPSTEGRRGSHCEKAQHAFGRQQAPETASPSVPLRRPARRDQGRSHDRD